jgi:multidrug efflux pump subunit AcrA (membrane-fusion protein)
MKFRRAALVVGLLLLAAAGSAGAWKLFNAAPKVPPHGTTVLHAAPSTGNDDEDLPESEDVVTVKIVKPRRDKAFTISVHQYASVEAYYEAELRARASGVVKYIPKDVGAPVTQGELLLEIDVPDLRQEVFQKDAVVEQRRQELRVAKSLLKVAAANVEVAHESIEAAQAKVLGALATREYRELRYKRLQQMALENTATAPIVDEEHRNVLAAQADWEAAKVAVRVATADLHQKEASLEAGNADITLKESLVHVAERDRDKTQAQADYARLTAPFDGVIVSRDVDLGTFVQNATAAVTRPLVTVARTDIVTVVTKLPDNVAPFVTRDTRVSLQLDELPGVTLEGRVSRFAPSFRNQDRTMQVEVDLFNGPTADYAKFLGQYFACQLAATGGAMPLGRATLAAAGRDQLGPRLKSTSDPLPLPPVIRGTAGEPPRLLPGMSGQMTVMLQKFANAYLLPSSAVFTRGGKPYILVVNDGTIRSMPVKVQVNDGRVAKVTVVARQANARTGETELTRELTGDEAVVASRQTEFSDGQAVKAYAEDW